MRAVVEVYADFDHAARARGGPTTASTAGAGQDIANGPRGGRRWLAGTGRQGGGAGRRVAAI